jgi:hypothetical protein
MVACGREYNRLLVAPRSIHGIDVEDGCSTHYWQEILACGRGLPHLSDYMNANVQMAHAAGCS